MKVLLTIILYFLLSISAFAQTLVGTDLLGYVNDGFSTAMSLSADGSTLAVGSPKKGSFTGNVKVFQNHFGIWTQLGEDITAKHQGDHCGISVSLSSDGQILAIGSSYNSDNGHASGHVRIYSYKYGSWKQLGPDIKGVGEFSNSGSSLYLSSDGLTIAIGGNINPNTGDSSGHIRIFEFKNDLWNETFSIASPPVSSWIKGYVSLSADGTTLATYEYWYDDTQQQDTSQLQVFRKQGNEWLMLAKSSVIIERPHVNSFNYRISLSADGTTIAIGEPNFNSILKDEGRVRVLKIENGMLIQKGNPLNGNDLSEHFGAAVALSADARTLICGAPYNDSKGANCGKVKVYQWDDGNWNQIGEDIYGDTLSYFGWSLAISASGNRFAIGSPIYKNSGIIRVYDLSESKDNSIPLLYPNPCSDILNVKIQMNLLGSHYIIHNSLGQPIDSGKFTQLNNHIKTHKYSSGVYLIKWNNGNKSKAFIVL